ncbi:MAG: radical SAM protein [candidate division WOR-3 bacterium]
MDDNELNQENKRYKPSKYNFFFDAEDGTHLAFNALSGGFAKIEAQDYQEVQKILQEPNTCDLHIGRNKELFQALVKGSFLIPENLDELALLKFKNRKARFQDTVLSLTLCPTMNCNFRCIYCFESPPSERSIMSEAVQERIIKFVYNRTKDVSKILQIGWFGGEPLLSLPVIEKLTQELKKICTETHSKYEAYLTTNGYLMTDKIIRKFEELSIKGVQVTIDGPPEIHNRYRPLKNGGETFNTVFNNLCRLVTSDIAKNLRYVNLRINFDENNYERVGEVLDLFPSDLRPQLNVYFKSTFLPAKKWGKNDHRTESYLCFKLNAPKLTMNLSKLAIKKGYNVSRFSRFGNSYFCPADVFEHFEIDSEGKVYKCNVSMEILPPVARIDEEGKCIFNSIQLTKWLCKDPFEDENCLNCKALPFCMGGCTLAKITSSGEGRGCLVESKSLEDALELFYLDYLNKINKMKGGDKK